MVAGAVAGWIYDRWARRQRDPEGTERMGVLLATGVYLVLERAIISMLLGIVLCGNGVNLLFIVVGGPSGAPPIVGRGRDGSSGMADPLAQEFVSWREKCQPTIRSTYQILSRGTPNLENETWGAAANVIRGTETPEAAAEKLQTGLASWYGPQQH